MYNIWNGIDAPKYQQHKIVLTSQQIRWKPMQVLKYLK